MSLQIYRLILKDIPKDSRGTVLPSIRKAMKLPYSPSELTAMQTYFSALRIHDEYLQFFGVSQVKDEKEKLKSVGRYVGLELPEIFGSK